MNDVFYFTKQTVTLQDISNLAAEDGYRSVFLDAASGCELNDYYKSEEFWQWIPIAEQAGDFNSFDQTSREIVDEYEPASAFIIAHRPMSWPELRLFLKRVLTQFGGWIGCDTDRWEPVFTLDNLDSQPYQPYLETAAWLAQTDKAHR